MTAALSLVLALMQAAPADTMLLRYEVNGMQVVHHRRPATSDVIAVQLYLLGGARQVSVDDAGIEPLILRASAYGTRQYPGEAARRALARTGGSISVSAESDWTVYAFHGLKQDFDSTWAVFADRLMHPTLDSAAVEIVRQRMLGFVARRNASPEDFAWMLADSMAFQGHAYAVSPGGTERSLRALRTDALRRYLAEQVVTSRMVLVVVGDLERDRVEGAVTRTLGTLPRGAYQWSLPGPVKTPPTAVIAANRKATTNYIVGTMFGPSRASPEYPAFERSMNILGGWISYIVREREALSYAAGVAVSDRGVPSASIYLSTTQPDTAMKLVNLVLNAFTTEFSVPRSALRSNAEGFTTAYIRQTETAAGQAALFGRALLYEGDPTAAARRADVMSKLTSHDLRRSAMEFTRCIQFAFVGDSARVPKEEMETRARTVRCAAAK